MNLYSSNNFPSSVPPYLLENKCRGWFKTTEFGTVYRGAVKQVEVWVLIFFFSLSAIMCSWEYKYSKECDRKEGTSPFWNWRKTIVAYLHSIVYPSCSYFALLISLVHLVKHHFFIKLIWQSPIHLWRNLLSILRVYIFNWKRSATATIPK